MAATLLQLLNENYSFNLKRMEKLDIEKGSFKSMKTRFNTTIEYLAYTDQNELNAQDVNYKFIDNYKDYLKVDKRLSPSYLSKHITWIKQVLSQAELHEVIPRNKIASYVYKRVNKYQENQLELTELYRLENARLRPALRKAANIFSFACYTGLAYCDLMRFNALEHIKNIDGKEWIVMERQKTEQSFYVPYFEEAKNIFESFASGIPKITNQRYNEHLKEIAIICGFNIKLSTHSARKTFAIVCSERYSFSLEAISFMLGHKDLKTTQKHYARVRLNLVKSELLRNVA